MGQPKTEDAASKRLTIIVDPELMRRVRVTAAVHGMTLSEFGKAAVEAYLEQLEPETADYLAEELGNE